MRVTYLEVCGFRSYGSVPQRLDLNNPLAVIYADNSQGKTGLAEAVEFLLTGAISRRLLLGGSKSEFEKALRNVHLSSAEPVYVELGFQRCGSTTAVLRRELDCDYRGANDCTSTLTIDGTKTPSVTAVGLSLSDPPLSAPVLLQHTLRYALSAKPGERSEYFKALLEVGDLEIVRDEVNALLSEHRSRPHDPLLIRLDELAALPTLATAIASLRTASTASEVETALVAACAAVDPSPPHGGPLADTLPAAVRRLKEGLTARQRAVLPTTDLLVPEGPIPPNDGELTSALKTASGAYLELAQLVDTEIAAVLPLLQAALAVEPVIAVDPTHPATCPLCLTPEALSAERMAAVRAQVAEHHHLSEAGRDAYKKLHALASQVRTLGRTALTAVPPAASWDVDVRTIRSSAADELGAHPGQLLTVLGAIDVLADTARSVGQTAETIVAALETMAEHAHTLQPIPPATLDETARQLSILTVQLEHLQTHRNLTKASSDALVASVSPGLEQGSDTRGWRSLVELAERPSDILLAVTRYKRHAVSTRRLLQAQRDIDEAVQHVLDNRLLAMGDEVRRWWGLLRPDELVTFDSLTRRGTGRRYLDLTATLQPARTAPGVVRNALAVFSDSQLNALGLAAFLARCHLLSSPLVILDDPIPSSDREHRGTFATQVMTNLLDDGHQVLLTTHDSELARDLHALYQHRGTDEYEATLIDPLAGTQLVRTGDEFEQLMLAASSQMHSPLRENRRAAGNSLRVAAERLAKHVTVAGRRRNGQTAALADYANKNLRDLRPLAANYALDPAEPGQWTVLTRELNDADHDTDPPSSISLKNCHGMLRRLKQEHLRNDAQLMRP